MNAVDEMSALNRDLKAFFDETGADYVNGASQIHVGLKQVHIVAPCKI